MIDDRPFDERAALDTLRRLAEHQGGSVRHFGPDTRLEEDLRLTGDDALEFIEAAARVLGIDMADFVPAEYIGPEAGLHLGFLGRLVGRPTGPVKALTMGRLTEAARIGRWTVESAQPSSST